MIIYAYPRSALDRTVILKFLVAVLVRYLNSSDKLVAALDTAEFNVDGTSHIYRTRRSGWPTNVLHANA